MKRSLSRFALLAGAPVVGLVLLLSIVATVGVVAIRTAVAGTEADASVYADDVVLVERLRFNIEEELSAARGYTLGHNPSSLSRRDEARDVVRQTLAALTRGARTKTGRALLADVGVANASYEDALDREVALHVDAANDGDVDAALKPAHETLLARVQVVVAYKRARLLDGLRRAQHAATEAMEALVASACLAGILGVLFGIVVARRLTIRFDAEQRAVREREDVLAVVSHDLRNPLHSIELAAHSLERGLQTHRTVQLAGRILRSTRKMGRLIEDLLDAAKLEQSGRLNLLVTDVDVRALVDDVVTSLQEAAAQKQVTVDALVVDDVRVSADADRLARVLTNLVGNAIQHAPAGSSVTIRGEPRESRARICVSNAGAPIAPEQAGHLFERYWSRSDGGTGLGLFIAKGIIDSHDGRLWLEPTTSGVTFCFEVPVGRGPGEQPVA